ncbi:MAG: hypothetical protein ACPKM0_08845 [Pleomorphochaeta sp.]
MNKKHFLVHCIIFSISILILTSCPTPGSDNFEIPDVMQMNLISKDSNFTIINGETTSESVLLSYSSPNNMNPEDGTMYYSIDSSPFKVCKTSNVIEISENGTHHIEIYFENKLGERGNSFVSCDFTINKLSTVPSFKLFSDMYSNEQIDEITNVEEIYIEPTFPIDETTIYTFQYKISESSDWITTYNRTLIYQTSEGENSELTIYIRYEEKSNLGDDAINTKTITIDRLAPTELTFSYPTTQPFRIAKTLWTNNNTDLVNIDVYYKSGSTTNYTLLESIGDGSSIIQENDENEVGAIEETTFKYILKDRVGNENTCFTESITPGNSFDPSTKALYVTPNGTGFGSTWETAYGDLQDAIDDAASSGIKFVNVKEGTYYPTSHPNGLESYANNGLHFALKNNVTITGGFKGSETDNVPIGGETILNGNNTSYHVIYLPSSSSITSIAILDNVSITKGKAYGSSQNGGGIYLQGATPTLKNLKIYDNYASSGSAIYIEDASVTLNNIQLYNNTSSNGGVININAWLNYYEQNFNNLRIFNNDDYSIYGNSNKKIKVNLKNTSIFKNGKSTIHVYNESLINMYNCSIAYNNASLSDTGFSTTSDIINSIIWKNGENNDSSGTYYPYNSIQNAKCSIIQDKNIIGDGYIAISKDTRLFKYDNDDDINNDFLSLYEDVRNPALDMGMSIEGITSDINNNQRLVDLNLTQIDNLRPSDILLINEKSGYNGNYCDLGPYEIQIPETMPEYLFVDNNAAPSDYSLFGYTSDNPSNDIQNALYLASIYDIAEVHVAKGIYYPKERPAITSDNSSESERFHHFMLINNIKLIGGYPSSFSNSFEETILSGNIGDLNDNTDNCYHVFYHSGNLHQLNPSAWIQKCTISDGYAWGYVNHYNGGGMYNCASYPTIVDCKFENNFANEGGAIYSLMDNGDSGTQSIWQSIFLDNTVSNAGGAIYVKDNIQLDLNQTVFIGNDSENSYGAPSIHLKPSANLNCYQSTFVNNPVSLNINMTSIIIEIGGTTPSKFYNSLIFEDVDDYTGTKDEITGEDIRESMYFNTVIPYHSNTEGISFVNTSYQENFAKAFDQILTEKDLYFNHNVSPGNQYLYHTGDPSYILKDIVDLDNDNNTSEYIPYDILGNPRLTNGELSIGAVQSEPEYVNY